MLFRSVAVAVAVDAAAVVYGNAVGIAADVVDVVAAFVVFDADIATVIDVVVDVAAAMVNAVTVDIVDVNDVVVTAADLLAQEKEVELYKTARKEWRDCELKGIGSVQQNRQP